MKKISLLLYILCIATLTVFSYFFIDQNLNYLHFLYSGLYVKQRITLTVLFSCIICLLFILYVFYSKTIKTKKVFSKEAKQYILISIMLVFGYPAALSYDIFNYVTTAKVLFFYHENPYVIMPLAFLNDPYIQFTRATNKIALYGPLWVTMSGIPYLVGFGNFIAILFSFKLFIALFYFATLFLLWKIEKSVYSLILFAVNPLVIEEALLSGHNDIVMMFFALLSLYLLKKEKYVVSIVSLLLSILIKYATIFLFPIFLYVLFRKTRNKQVNMHDVYFFSSVSMLAIFFLSTFREEIYSWYGIWFFLFSVLALERRIYLMVCISLTFGLSLRYIPYMLLGTYANPTPFLKNVFTFLPVLLCVLFIAFQRLLWLKKHTRS